MTEIVGDFETHLTVLASEQGLLEAFAAEHGLSWLVVELDRGRHPVQPMLTLRGSGTLSEQMAAATGWSERLRAAHVWVRRSKIEAVPWADGVPQDDAAAAGEPAGRYFEHHIKIVQPGTVPAIIATTEVAERHGARLSRNARRERADGTLERFVNQRCHGVGRATAADRLDRLVAELRELGREIVSVEQEYVVHDSNLDLDQGWLTADRAERREAPVAPAYRPDFPATYHPIPPADGVVQRLTFDPSAKHHPNAYLPGEPEFDDPDVGRRWRAARAAAMRHVLSTIARGPWAGNLVLRGSVTMPAWVGEAAREPGSLDFVVIPRAITSDHPRAGELLTGIVAGVAADPGAGLCPERTRRSEIWTYERAEGRRLVIPFTAGVLPGGAVQIDVVFNEELPVEPEPIILPGVPEPVPAVTAGLSLAWKLLWLATDWYPQGKDLYDAMLLAEHTAVDLALVRRLVPDFTPATVLSWRVEGEGDEQAWIRRLAVALESGPVTRRT